jgi:hypothetical protein
MVGMCVLSKMKKEKCGLDEEEQIGVWGRRT